MGGEAAANVMVPASLQDEGMRRAAEEAFAWSIRNMWIMFTCLSFLGVVSSVFVKGKSLSWEHRETRTGLREKEKEKEER